MSPDKRRSSLTPKQRVLKKHPGAWLWLQPQELYQVMPRRAHHVGQSLGCGETPREAWADAARQERPK